MTSVDIALSILAGLAAGILVNYLADVLPATRRLSRPPWWPLSAAGVAAYLRRRRVLVVLLAFTLLALLLLRFPPNELSASFLALLLVYFGLVIVIDIEHRAILHPVSLTGALVFGIWGILRHGWLATLLGGAAGFLIMLAFYWLGDLLGRWLAHRRGEAWDDVALGFGDVNLSGVIGLLLGWPSVLGGLLLGILAGGLFSAGHILVELLRGRYRALAAIPYGPFLSIGALGLILLRAYT
jgi:leader peptidase (prepilin peptidase)/N-methyltransferase